MVNCAEAVTEQGLLSSVSGCFIHLENAATELVFFNPEITRSVHTSSCGIHPIYNLVWMPKTCEYCLPQNY